MKKAHVAVLMGGLSSEREVSLKSGKNVAEALESLGYEVKTYDPATELNEIIEDKEWIDVVFPALHGKYGEDGTVQGFCELLQLPYVGSGVLASAQAMDKIKTIQLYKSAGLPVAESITLEGAAADWKRVEKEIGFPCVIKPILNGSSIGVEIVDNLDQFKNAYDRVKALNDGIMVEK